MNLLAAGLCGPAHDPRAAYADSVIAVVVTDAIGRVTFANANAEEVFSPLLPVTFGLRTLFALSGTTGGGELARAAEAGKPSASVRIGLPDGRIFDSRSRPLPDGGVLITFYDITSYVRDAELAVQDTLTGLATRDACHKRLAELLVERRGTGGHIAVISLDLDSFKTVNDTLGHPVGDALLVKVAERLRGAVRADETVARLGDDKFAILQSSAPQPQAAEALAARLVDLIGRTYIAAGHMLNVGANVGIAIAPDDGDDGPTLLKHADLALYRAKSDGRRLFRFFQTSMDFDIQARRQLEIDLRRALALKEFVLYYQPQVDLDSNTLVGFEALLRWRSPARGLVSPGEFVPLAEEIGLIGQIGDWVLHTACREAAAWDSPATIGVNVSPLQFRGSKLVPAVASALAKSGLDPARLDLEITESSLLDDAENVLQVLQDLKALGVRISMDDFGTGYSSLSYLQKFPFDKIKIDQSFVRNTNTIEDSGAIVQAVAALAKSLGMKTIAEGVETQEQLDRVRAGGCSEVQGYLTGRPLPASEAASLMSGFQKEKVDD